MVAEAAVELGWEAEVVGEDLVVAEVDLEELLVQEVEGEGTGR